MSHIAIIYFPALMFFAAISDLFTMRIPNWLVLAVGLAFFPAAIIVQMPWEAIGLHVLCAFAVLVVAFGLFALNVIGGGDAKFAAATVLWLGAGQVLPYLVYASVFGGVLTILILLLRSLPLEVWITRFEWLSRLHNRKNGVPYGIALAIAAVFVYPETLIYNLLVQS
ncbi:prepilin peptidase [Devosia sp. WQ 349K1]|uniref:A24 family peptidase n=1 Tax=Devosia sp. WQ 349K1 TaxID=2800329 RepID=UPI0020B2C28A|nr:prepilin peptidase [Devosia sp. WQ 349K1]